MWKGSFLFSYLDRFDFLISEEVKFIVPLSNKNGSKKCPSIVVHNWDAEILDYV